MRKMNQTDINFIVNILHGWKSRHLNWNILRQQISTELLDGEPSWSRQSLQANEAIRIAWSNTKLRRSTTRKKTASSSSLDPNYILEKIQAELQDLKTQYDNLALRHRQVVFNASLLPGGMRLLIDPLPDNSMSQRVGKKNN